VTTSFDTCIDNSGNPYPAVRPLKGWRYALSGAGSGALGPFLATTKVVRINAGIADLVQVTFPGQAFGIIVGRGVYQDFIVQPGDTLTVALDPASATGTVSALELG
jgi:hypothetical protein